MALARGRAAPGSRPLFGPAPLARAPGRSLLPQRPPGSRPRRMLVHAPPVSPVACPLRFASRQATGGPRRARSALRRGPLAGAPRVGEERRWMRSPAASRRTRPGVHRCVARELLERDVGICVGHGHARTEVDALDRRDPQPVIARRPELGHAPAERMERDERGDMRSRATARARRCRAMAAVVCEAREGRRVSGFCDGDMAVSFRSCSSGPRPSCVSLLKL